MNGSVQIEWIKFNVAAAQLNVEVKRWQNRQKKNIHLSINWKEIHKRFSGTKSSSVLKHNTAENTKSEGKQKQKEAITRKPYKEYSSKVCAKLIINLKTSSNQTIFYLCVSLAHDNSLLISFRCLILATTKNKKISVNFDLTYFMSSSIFLICSFYGWKWSIIKY